MSATQQDLLTMDGVTKVFTTDYTFDLREGRVIFTVNLPADAEVTVSYSHSLPWEISQACAILTARDLGEADLRAKGMEGLASLQIKDVTMSRGRMTSGSAKGSGTTMMNELPGEVQRLLSGYVFVTAR